MSRLHRRSGLCLLLLAAVLAAYAPALLHGGFTWDDYKFVEANPRLTGPEGLKAIWLQPGTASSHEAAVPEVEVHWFPVLYTSFWLERRLWGSFLAPGFHGTNLLIHFCNALLAWGLPSPGCGSPAPSSWPWSGRCIPGPWRPSASSWAARTSSPHPSSCWRPGPGSGRSRPFRFRPLPPVPIPLRPCPAPRFPRRAPSPAIRREVARETTPAVDQAIDPVFRDAPRADHRSRNTWAVMRPRPPMPRRGRWSRGRSCWARRGMLCKTTAVVLPVLLLLLHLRRGDPLSRGLAGRLALLQAVLVGVALFQWFVFARLSDPAVHDFSFTERVLLAARAAWTHLFLTLVPGPSPLRFHSWTVSPTDLAGWAALAAWGIVLPVALRLRPYSRSALLSPASSMQGQAPFSPAGADPRFPLAGAGLGLLWFLVCLSPTLGLVDHPSLHMSLAWSRYRYLASLGPWALVVGAGLAALRHVSRQPRRLPRALGRGALRGLGLAALLTAGLTTARFSILFSNDATWFQHLTRHAPASDWLASHFVNALIRAGHTGRALRVAEARFLSDPSRLRYRRDRAIARMAAGRPAPAEADFRALVSLLDRDPGLIPPPPCISPRTLAGYWPLERDDLHLVYYNYGLLLSELDRPFEARDMFFRARQVRPGPGDVWIFRTGPADPPIVAVGPPAGSGERRCAPRPPGG